MSTLLFTERPRVLRLLTDECTHSVYWRPPTESQPDIFLQFPTIRLREYFDFFQSLQMISPENHPDYFHRSLVLDELKLQLNDIQRKLNSFHTFLYIQNLFRLRLTGAPVSERECELPNLP